MSLEKEYFPAALKGELIQRSGDRLFLDFETNLVGNRGLGPRNAAQTKAKQAARRHRIEFSRRVSV